VKAALRENLDVIFVGEMRDLETIEQVPRAAERGHVVINTLHSDDALSAVTRIVGSFPPNEQPRTRQRLAGVLSGVVFQRLLPSASGGRCHHQRSRGP
jgi:twitching motility protein PilT